MSKSHTFSLIVLILSVNFTIDCWVINNVNVSKLKSQLYDDLSDEEFSQLKFALIYPGTKWCGAGNISDDYNDLGKERETDMCCREHDYCPDSLSAGETRHNLTNEAFYTRLHCKCDERFRKCLRNANSSAAKNIGLIYFDMLDTKCYRLDYPVLKCTQRGGWLNRKCLEHTYDTSAKKIYQWFDVPNY